MKVRVSIIGGSGVEVFHRRLASALSGHGVESQITKFSPRWEYFPWALKWIPGGKEPFDLMHVNVEYGCFFINNCCPFLATLHHCTIDDEFLRGLPLLTRTHHRSLLVQIVAQTIREARALVGVSQYTKRSFCNFFQDDLPIEVIHNGVDPVLYAPSNYPLSKNGPIRLFFSGNLSHRKGVDLMASMMRELGKDFLLLYTSGLRHTYSPIAGENTRYLGFLEEPRMIEILQSSDIVLHPSRREGFGQSILEGMACGKPIVATQCSAIPELVDHEKGGYLCEPESVAQLVSAVKRLSQSSDHRQAMGAYNRQVVLERFTLDRMARRYYTVYQSLAQD